MSSSVPQKRKAETEYSSNPNTVKSTKRREGLDPRNKEWEDAKQLDAKAITYRQKKVKQSEAYEAASEEEKQRMLDRIEVEVMIGRYGLTPCFLNLFPNPAYANYSLVVERLQMILRKSMVAGIN